MAVSVVFGDVIVFAVIGGIVVSVFVCDVAVFVVISNFVVSVDAGDVVFVVVGSFVVLAFLVSVVSSSPVMSVFRLSSVMLMFPSLVVACHFWLRL